MADQESRSGFGSGSELLEMQEEPPGRSSRLWPVVALLVGSLALAALATTAWLFVDRQGLADELGAARTNLREARDELDVTRVERDQLRRELQQEERRGQRLAASTAVCLEAMENGVRLYNTLVDELRAIVALDRDRARELFEQAREQTRDANRSLQQCRRQMG